MTKALSQDPVALYNMLTARKKDLLAMRDRTPTNQVAAMVDEALVGLDDAIIKTVDRLNKLAAAEAAEDPDELPKEFSIPDDAPALDHAGTDDAAPPEPSSPEPAEEDAEEQTNAVAMSAKLRKAMGEMAADMLDDYALKIHKSVVTFFENLTKKALDLGTEDASDSQNSLREVLLSEVGKRGLASVETNFVEWRESLIKKMWKDVSSMFTVPETEEQKSSDFPVDVPATPDSAPEPEPKVEETPVAPEQSEPEALEAPQDNTKQPVATASVLQVTAAPVRFTIHKDMKPAGMKSVKLT